MLLMRLLFKIHCGVKGPYCQSVMYCPKHLLYSKDKSRITKEYQGDPYPTVNAIFVDLSHCQFERT